jgi:hypothetical protein
MQNELRIVRNILLQNFEALSTSTEEFVGKIKGILA